MRSAQTYIEKWNKDLPESGVTRKRSRSVREGAIGKVPKGYSPVARPTHLSHLKQGVYELEWRLRDSNVAISCGNVIGWIEKVKVIGLAA